MIMTYDDVVAMAEATGLPFAYDHFAEGESPDPPFLVFLFPGSNNFSADGISYLDVDTLHFELYTDRKSPDVERIVEAALKERGIFYNRSETWLPSEKLYEVLYEMEVMKDAEEE